MTPCVLFFIRHGQTDFPKGRMYTQLDDPPLNSTGITQSQILGQYFLKSTIDAAYSSKKKRCVSTAKFICKKFNLTPVVTGEIEERNSGIFGGLTKSEIASKDPTHYKLWCMDKVNFRPPGGESIAELYNRVNRWIKKITNLPGQSIGVVCHAGPIRAACINALSIPLSQFQQIIIPPGSVTRIEYTKETTTLVYLGRIPCNNNGKDNGDNFF